MTPTRNLQLVLASTSPYRCNLLSKLGIPFLTVNPSTDEGTLPGESPAELALRLALAKSKAGAKQHGHGLVIGSDQVACLDEMTLGKPGTMERAIEQLRSSSGRWVEFHTAITVTDAASDKSISRLETTRVHFRELSESQIIRYLEAERPFDCAGSFKSEGLGIVLFKEIQGRDPNALIGLPLIALVDLLGAFGVTVP